MRFGRPVSAIVVAVGLLAGTLGESTPHSRPRQAEGYWILAADFHVHGFPGDGALAPGALRREVQRAGLDVFTLTNHNRVSTARLARWLAGYSTGPIVIVGQEITAPGYHMTAAGIEERVDWETSPAAAIRAVHAQGGVAIANHPESADYIGAYDDEALALLDGVERTHPVIETRPGREAVFAEFFRRTQQVNPGVAAIGSSDFHFDGAPGFCRTYVLARERTTAGVLDAVREGRTVAADRGGRLYGDPRMVRIVEAAGGFVAPPAATDRWPRLAVGMTWIGLLGLVVLGDDRPQRARGDDRLQQRRTLVRFRLLRDGRSSERPS